MLATKKFQKGGVHPHDNKQYSAHLPIVEAKLPKTVKIPLIQHIGKPAKCIVKAGDEVKAGDVIGEIDGFISSYIHSSVSGKIKSIEQGFADNGRKCDVVVIESNDESVDFYTKADDYKTLSNEEMVDRIRKAGIVGLGGATFPTHVKLSPPKEKKIRYFLINGVECEPYLTSDHRLMLEKTKEIMEGIKIIKKILDVEKVYIGIENNKKDAQDEFEKLCKNEENIYVVPLRVRYPQGGEKQLIDAVFNVEVPSGGLPMDVETVVQNIGTILAVYEAVVYNKPLIERIVTVTGSLIKEPANFLCKIGTPFSELLEQAGLAETPSKIISGGPMMGTAVANSDIPVTKGTSGILALSEKELGHFEDYDCIKCSACVRACPMSLMPTMITDNIKVNRFEEAKKIGILDCMECGSCAYVCPAKIPIVNYIKFGKTMLRLGIKYADGVIPYVDENK